MRQSRRSPGLRLLAALTVLAAGAGCGSSGSRASAPTGSTAGRTPGASSASLSSASLSSTSPTSASATGAAPGSAGADCAQRALVRLGDEQLVGQLFIVGIPATGADRIQAAARVAEAAHAGGYILYGGTDAGVAPLRALTTVLDTRLAARASGIRPFVAADQEGGQIQGLSGPGFSDIPSALVQGAWRTSRLRTAARTWGEQLRSAGVNLDFAPVLDVVPAALGTANQPIGRYQRQFGSSPGVVAAHGEAVLRGLQAAGVMATGKHFPGLGRVIGNTDVTAGVTDWETTVTDPDLEPFQAAIRAGVPFVMVSSAVYRRIDPGTPAVFSATVMSLLRQRLHFTGLIASDDIGAAKQVADVAAGDRALRFLRAGGQVVVVVKPAGAIAAMTARVLAVVRAVPGFRATVRAAALAVLEQKQRAGLLTC